ncbi:MAG: FAD-dependent monooxygenase [Stenomitos rutilans HA7619-LM2]|jgi:salicylate hydroxylase|nr:FAD-dependent monooxygenase [Stenomitos rutilans HA7619-LM2]
MSESNITEISVPLEVDVAIVGAGIGGLAAAVALRQVGITAHVYERTKALQAIGGAVVIREPSVRLFEQWGVADRFYAEAVQLQGIDVRDSEGTPIGTIAADLTGEGNAYSVHRADVHALLLSGVDQQCVHLGMTSVEAFEDGDRGVVRFADGRQVRAKVVIGADGIKSVVRKSIDNDALIFSKLVVLRGLAPSAAMPEDMPNDRLYSWEKDSRQMLLLPLRGGNEVAMDTIMVRDTPPQDLWTSEVPTSELLDYFQGFDPDMIKLIEAGTVPVRANPVYEREPIAIWSTAHITLLGDAAHPMAPRAGQGANQAIQDAGALARALSGDGMTNIPDALRRYHEERAPLTKKMQLASRSSPAIKPLPVGK